MKPDYLGQAVPLGHLGRHVEARSAERIGQRDDFSLAQVFREADLDQATGSRPTFCVFLLVRSGPV